MLYSCMKRIFAALFFLCFNVLLTAQNFDHVDSRVRSYPSRYSSAEQLAAQIQADFTKEIDKARAIFTWLSLNVAYDLETLEKGQTQINFSYTSQEDLKRKLEAINTNTINATLRTNKAICEGYAQTFKRVAELLNMPCMLIGGYSKGDVSEIGRIPPQENHAWNAIKINKKWHLVDPTWGAGVALGRGWVHRFNDFFFLTDPKKFALTHFPSERMWFLTDTDLSLQEFYKAPIFENAYFLNRLTLLSPKQGIIYARANGTIKFTMATIPANTNLFYAYTDNKYTHQIEPYCAQGKCTFEIPVNSNGDSELLIFANKSMAMQFKVKIVE